MKIINQTRAEQAATVLNNYAPEPETVLRDLLADLMHYAEQNDFDFEYELEVARGHFNEEVDL